MYWWREGLLADLQRGPVVRDNHPDVLGAEQHRDQHPADQQARVPGGGLEGQAEGLLKNVYYRKLTTGSVQHKFLKT